MRSEPCRNRTAKHGKPSATGATLFSRPILLRPADQDRFQCFLDVVSIPGLFFRHHCGPDERVDDLVVVELDEDHGTAVALPGAVPLLAGHLAQGGSLSYSPLNSP